MADEVIKAGAEFQNIVPEIWSAAFYPTLLEAMPFNESIARDYEGEISDLGNTVNINTFPQFDLAEEIAENQKADADSISPTKTQLVINKRLVKDYILTKRAMAQSIDASDKLRDLAMHSIMKKMQQLIIADITPAVANALSYDSGTTLALADILEAKETLDSNDVEELGRTMIVGSAQYNDLFNINGFTSRDFIPAGSPLTQGAITTPILGFQFKWTTEAANTSYFFSPIFFQMAVQEAPAVAVYDQGVEGKRSMRVNMDVLYGQKQLSDVRVVTIS